MDTMINVWTVVENVRVASGAAELAIFTAILYWFFTSSRVADMLEVVGERVGGWCGRDSSGSLRQAVRRRHRCDVYSKLDQDTQSRTASLYKVKEGPVVPAPQPIKRPPAGLACPRCAPLSRESWQDPKATEQSTVINILDIGRQKFANGGVMSRYLCDLAQCCNLLSYDYKDVVEDVKKDERFQSAIEQATTDELLESSPEQDIGESVTRSPKYQEIKRKVEAKAMKVLSDITSAMSNNVLKLVAWLCHKAIRRIANGGCVTRSECVERLRRAKAAGLPLVFVPLHRSHFDYVLVTFTLYLTGLRPPLVAAGDNMRIPFFGWFLRGCGAFYIKRRADGTDSNKDNIYKSALRAYILNSLAANNNLEFFIEGGRTRTGKPQPPKAGILSVIMDAYLDGTIDDALLVPVTLNYDKLVDGNFVREQLGMPKQMETFWSALRGIWRTLNTNHGTIRVDFNQPISLKELVTSFKKYNYLKFPIERTLTPPNNNLAVTLDKQILYNHSHSSLYAADVSTDHKMMVEAIGRHLVYDAAVSTPLMCTNVVSYVLLSEQRGGCSVPALCAAVCRRAAALQAAGRDLGYSGPPDAAVHTALELLGSSLVARGGGRVAARRGVAASLELAYYAQAVAAHYAAAAIMVTALEVLINQPNADAEFVRHSELIDTSLQLCEVLSREFILTAACTRAAERMCDVITELEAGGILKRIQQDADLEEQRWSRRFARTLEDDDEASEPVIDLKYQVSNKPDALAERRRLLLTIRPLLESYAATCECVRDSTQKQAVKSALDLLTERVARRKMLYGEAVSTDAIMNCHRLLKQWGVIDIYNQNRTRMISLTPQYKDKREYDAVCENITKFNVDTPLLSR